MHAEELENLPFAYQCVARQGDNPLYKPCRGIPPVVEASIRLGVFNWHKRMPITDEERMEYAEHVVWWAAMSGLRKWVADKEAALAEAQAEVVRLRAERDRLLLQRRLWGHWREQSAMLF